MTNEHDVRGATAWRYAVVSVVLNIVGMLLELLIVRTIPHVSIWPPVGSIAAGAALLGVLLARRHRRTRLLGNTVFLVNVVAIILALWALDAGFASSGRTWVPFQEYKLGMITVAVLAPEAWIGGLCIAAYAITPIVQLETFGALRDDLAIGEPIATIAIATFSAALLWYRLRRTALELDIAVARAQLASTQHLARVLLAVRDLANTPLQTIAFAAQRAREMHDDIGPVMDRVDRSLDKLRELDRRLRGYDEALTWTEREESLDALDIAATAMRPRSP